MIDRTEVKETIQRHLVDNWAGDPVSFAFVNDDEIPARPYIALQIITLSDTDPTLDGEGRTLVQRLQATVVTERGTYETDGDRIGQQIEPLFPHGTRFAITGAEITIRTHVRVGDGFGDGFDFRTPATFDYEVSNVG